ncbi:hypothetical protein HK436_27635 [Mesorhizobium sediminum]|nr:hypothetical protein [Mesorhizobium sediminum]
MNSVLKGKIPGMNSRWAVTLMAWRAMPPKPAPMKMIRIIHGSAKLLGQPDRRSLCQHPSIDNEEMPPGSEASATFSHRFRHSPGISKRCAIWPAAPKKTKVGQPILRLISA